MSRLRGIQFKVEVFALKISELHLMLPGPALPVISAKLEDQQQAVSQNTVFGRLGGKRSGHFDLHRFLHDLSRPAGNRRNMQWVHLVLALLRINSIRTVDPGTHSRDGQLRSAPVVRRIHIVTHRKQKLISFLQRR